MSMDLFSEIDNAASSIHFSEGLQYEKHWNSDLGGVEITLSDGALFFSERFFKDKISDRSLEYFLENNTYDAGGVDWTKLSENELADIEFDNINWKQDRISLYGKNHLLPRLTAWFGDARKDYTYSGITSHPNQWNKGLNYIKTMIEEVSGERFNSVLLNWYRNGEDHLSWHADNEKELGHNPVIVSANFGETRDFVLRRNDDHRAKVTIPLNHGSLLVMRGSLQHFWQHSIPKRKRVGGSRINLTFRQIK